VQGVSFFRTKTIVAKMFNLPKIGINKLPAKPTKEKESEKEATITKKSLHQKQLLIEEA
jgi:hypothetical protein